MVEFFCNMPSPVAILIYYLCGCAGGIYIGISVLTHDKDGIWWGYWWMIPMWILVICLEIQYDSWLFRIFFVIFSILAYLCYEKSELLERRDNV